MPIILLRLYRWIQIERVQQASAQFEHLNGRFEPCLGPQAVFACPLSPRSTRIQQDSSWKEIRGVKIA